ncbi:MAG: hypothetical protein QF473_20330, partial [Planctomycetota bacterium]|nr:hypothetical protein [Planctomycetota bacterium]
YLHGGVHCNPSDHLRPLVRALNELSTRANITNEAQLWTGLVGLRRSFAKAQSARCVNNCSTMLSLPTRQFTLRSNVSIWNAWAYRR